MRGFWEPSRQNCVLAGTFQSFFVIVIAVAVAMFLPFWSLGLAIYYTHNFPGRACLIILLVLTIVTSIFILGLHITTNASFLSQMLAQRWNALSYAAALGLMAICFYSSALICNVYTIRNIGGIDDPHWKIILSTLSLIFLSMTSFFPNPLERGSVDTGMEPQAYCIEGTTSGNKKTYVPDVFGFSYYLCGNDSKAAQNLMLVFHYFFLIAGAVLGFIFMGLWFTENYDNDDGFAKMDSVSFFNIIGCGVSLLGILVARSLGVCGGQLTQRDALIEQKNEPEFLRRLCFAAEVCFVFSLINGILFAVLAESDFYSLSNSTM